MTRTLFLPVLLAAAWTAHPTPLRAALPTLESLSPGVGQQGTEFTLTLSGARLGDPQELLFYAPGIACSKLTAKGEQEVVATLKAAPDCPLGAHAFRLRTTGGVSELRQVHVTALPVVMEVEPNDTPAEAQKLTPGRGGVTVAAVNESGGYDHYRVTLQKGQRLSAEVEGIRLGAALTDTLITLLGPGGEVLARVDDTPLYKQDPFVSVVAPADGDYLIRVQDTNFGGGDSHRYLLHVGDFPRPAGVFPLGGQAGTTLEVQLRGEPAGPRTQAVALPRDPVGYRLYAADGAGRSPTDLPFRVSNFPNVLEAEPNDAHAQASPAAGSAKAPAPAWPVAFNGVIQSPGDVDHFRFTARKNDRIEVNTFAHRAGTALDSVVTVYDAGGEMVARGDDAESLDSQFALQIPRDGEYTLRVEDKRKQGGADYAYRVELDRPRETATAFLATPTRRGEERQAINVPRGNRIHATLAVRRDGVRGPLRIVPESLPPGVTVEIPPIGESEYLAPVVFQAGPDAPPGGALVRFRVLGDGQEVRGGFEQRLRTLAGPGDTAFQFVRVDALAVCVTAEAPFRLSITPPTVALPVDGTLELKLNLTRGEGFTAAVEVSFPCLPPGVETPLSVLIPAGQASGVVTLSAQKDADLGAWPLVAEATIARPSRATPKEPADPASMPAPKSGARPPRKGAAALELPTPLASEVVTLRTAAPALRGTLANAAAEPGKAFKLTLKLAEPLPGGAQLTAKLDGLPPRVTAAPVAVPAMAREVVFDVQVDATTPLGNYPGVQVEFSGTLEGQKVTTRVGRGTATLRIDPPGGTQMDASGKPLSPLDALRQQPKKK